MHPSVCKQIFGEFECVYTLTCLRFLYKNVVIYKRIRVYTILSSRSFCQLCIACLYLVYEPVIMSPLATVGNYLSQNKAKQQGHHDNQHNLDDDGVIDKSTRIIDIHSAITSTNISVVAKIDDTIIHIKWRFSDNFTTKAFSSKNRYIYIVLQSCFFNLLRFFLIFKSIISVGKNCLFGIKITEVSFSNWVFEFKLSR